MEKYDFDLVECVESALELMTVEADAKGLGLTCKIESDVPRYINSDVTRLRQILINLIGNAIKFTESGHVHVAIQKVSQEEAHITSDGRASTTELKFSVTDTGIGLTKDQQKNLFNSFSQADASMSRRFGGTGLGLAISRRLCQLMGGEISIESNGVPGLGSTFSFWILTTDSTDKAAAIQESEHRHRHAHFATDNRGINPQLRILLAEDNLVNQKLALYILEKAGLRADTAGNGLEVIEALERQMYDIVLMDVQMPELDGLEATKHIRKQRLYGKMPYIIALTANAMSEDRAICIAAGMDAYLSKPVRAAELIEALQMAQSVCRSR